MAYSRWGNSCWYTYWSWRDIPPERKEDEEMYIHYDLEYYGLYTYKELKEEEEDILFTIGIDAGASADEIDELSVYIQRFIHDVDKHWESKDD